MEKALEVFMKKEVKCPTCGYINKDLNSLGYCTVCKICGLVFERKQEYNEDEEEEKYLSQYPKQQ